MLKSTRSWGVFAAVVVMSLQAHAALAATTRVVGTCTPTVAAKFHYTTIQAAVNASILSGVPATILVCPGTYREQVVIGISPDYAPIINMKGTDLAVGPAIIKSPTAGLVANYNSPSLGWIAVQLLVRDTTGVTVSNLEVDGTGGGCPRVGGVAARTTGVAFVNAGDYENYAWSTTAGSVKFMSIHDQQYPWTAECGTDSFGILTEQSYIKVNDNTLTRINDIGIFEVGGNNEMLRNRISSCGGHGIVVDNGLMSDVSLNTLSQINLNGIVLQNGTNLATVELNTFSPALAVGIYVLGAHDNYIHRNTVSSTFGAIFLDGGSANNVVEDNQLDHCGFACLLNRFSSGGNRIAFNDLETSAAYGVWQHHGEGDEVYGNVFNNVPTMSCNSTVAFFSFDRQFCAPDPPEEP